MPISSNVQVCLELPDVLSNAVGARAWSNIPIRIDTVAVAPLARAGLNLANFDLRKSYLAAHPLIDLGIPPPDTVPASTKSTPQKASFIAPRATPFRPRPKTNLRNLITESIVAPPKPLFNFPAPRAKAFPVKPNAAVAKEKILETVRVIEERYKAPPSTDTAPSSVRKRQREGSPISGATPASRRTDSTSMDLSMPPPVFNFGAPGTATVAGATPTQPAVGFFGFETPTPAAPKPSILSRLAPPAAATFTFNSPAPKTTVPAQFSFGPAPSSTTSFKPAPASAFSFGPAPPSAFSIGSTSPNPFIAGSTLQTSAANPGTVSGKITFSKSPPAGTAAPNAFAFVAPATAFSLGSPPKGISVNAGSTTGKPTFAAFPPTSASPAGNFGVTPPSTARSRSVPRFTNVTDIFSIKRPSRADCERLGYTLEIRGFAFPPTFTKRRSTTSKFSFHAPHSAFSFGKHPKA
ncbi:hypothetical protein HKX48_008015 [Thoreauomyces humboldtii]|nr:hypothetical protein HKX48_008015 [Thoreauomyces humboldtii]